MPDFHLDHNVFYRGRRDIAAIAEANKYDADTACIVYAAKKGLHAFDGDLKEFREAMRRAQLNKTGSLYDLFYK